MGSSCAGLARCWFQAGQSVETPVAEIAAIPGAVPRRRAGDVRGSAVGVFVVVPANALVGEDVVGVHLPAVVVDFGAGDARGAAAGFEMQADAG